MMDRSERVAAMGASSHDGRLRVGDVDRDACVAQLQDHFVAGRIASSELDERVGKALVARTQEDLAELLADCAPRRRPTSDPIRRRAVVLAAVVAVLLAPVGALVVTEANRTVHEVGCAATGVIVPDGAQCPPLTRQQERLMRDAQSARAAADQVQQATSGTGDRRLEALAQEADRAAELAGRAEAEAQLVVATAPEGGLAEGALDGAAADARRAASDATRAAIEANQLASR